MFPREQRAGGTYGVEAILAHQGPHAFHDPATDDVVIGLTLAGRTPARWQVAGRWREIDARTPGTIGVSPIGEPLDLDVAAAHTLLVVAVPIAVVREVSAEAGVDGVEALASAHSAYHRNAATQRDLRGLWSALADRSDPTTSILADGLTLSALARLIRHLRREPAATPRKVEPPLDLDELEAFVRATVPEAVSVASLARHVGVGRSALYRLFQRQTGTSPYAFVQDVRLRMARDMLTRGRRRPAEVAAELGFSDQSHLTRVLRAATGRTPRQLTK